MVSLRDYHMLGEYIRKAVHTRNMSKDDYFLTVPPKNLQARILKLIADGFTKAATVVLSAI